jgi:hypothetical protein
VTDAASTLSPEKRDLFLWRVAARLRLRGPRFTDTSRIDGINPIGSMGNALA